MTENKSQKEVLFRNRPQRRTVLLYENQLLFCKQIRAKPGKVILLLLLLLLLLLPLLLLLLLLLLLPYSCSCSSFPHQPGHQFKFSLAIANLGMSSIIKGEEKKMELWVIGQADVYSLQAKNKKTKEEFAAELRKVDGGRTWQMQI